MITKKDYVALGERPKDIGKACRVLKISRSSLQYRSVKDDSAIIRQNIIDLALANKRMKDNLQTLITQ